MGVFSKKIASWPAKKLKDFDCPLFGGEGDLGQVFWLLVGFDDFDFYGPQIFADMRNGLHLLKPSLANFQLY